MKVIAFVPVRGGSKSIHLKNIKPFCGQPLVFWCLKALVKANAVDVVVVATDSEAISETVSGFQFDKVEIYRRDPQNATDSASTESVMLEYIQKQNCRSDDIFLLVQATSPFTEDVDIEQALAVYHENAYDSLLTCVRSKRFFWQPNGQPINYNYRERPRRQDFDGMLMENGAFYINRVGNVIRDKNRLSGHIGIYEMAPYKGCELDEEEDWILGENLMKRYGHLSDSFLPIIRLFLTDVDGVLTDEGMYYSEKGDELKRFNTKDGKGIELLIQKGLQVGIITAENTQMVRRRATKLKIHHLYQGAADKVKVAEEIAALENISLAEMAYIGDDINDIDLLEKVGLAACPQNAVSQVKAIPNIIQLSKSGGKGVVREFAEIILQTYSRREIND